MLGMYKAVVGSLNAQIRLLGRDHDTVAKARAAEIVHFKQTLSRTAVTSADAHALYDELSKPDNPFTEAERKDLGEAVALQGCSGRVPEASDTVGDLRQKCMYFYNYMPDDMWTSVLDKNVSVDITLSQLASLGVHTLGLVKPCEQTARVITATAIVAKQLTFMPVQMQAKVKALKTAFTELRHIHKPMSTFKTFPEHVADFVSVYPGRYDAAQPPMEPRIEVRAVLDMCRPDVMPCRKSASSLRLTAPSSSSSTQHMQPYQHYAPQPFAQQHQQPPMPMNGDAFAQMFRCMMNFVSGQSQGAGDQQSSSSTPAADTIPGMQYFFQPGAPPACSTPPRVQPVATPTLADTAIVVASEQPPSAASPAAIASDDVRKRVHEVLALKAASASTKKKKKIRKSTKMPPSDNDAEDNKDNKDDDDEDEVDDGKKPAGSVLRRPAAHCTPAAANTATTAEIQHVLPHLFEETNAKNKSRGAYTSRAYDTVKRSHGMDRAREAYKYSAKVWDDMNAA
jgi:hypothetical protein